MNQSIMPAMASCKTSVVSDIKGSYTIKYGGTTRMGYTIKNFICSNKFLGMKLISDNSGINREIRGVRIIVDPNMENFLGGVSCSLSNRKYWNVQHNICYVVYGQINFRTI